jgi:hypothetical protein
MGKTNQMKVLHAYTTNLQYIRKNSFKMSYLIGSYTKIPILTSFTHLNEIAIHSNLEKKTIWVQ